MSVHYMGGVHELSRRTFTTLEDIMSAVGDIVSTHTVRVSTLGDTIIYAGKISDKIIEFAWKLRCTEHPPMYSILPYALIKVRPWCTHNIP